RRLPDQSYEAEQFSRWLPLDGSCRAPAQFLKLPADGRARVVIEDVAPIVDNGRFPLKRAIGETVVVQASVFADGHDAVSCRVLYKTDNEWLSTVMIPLGHDRWEGVFSVSKLGRYTFTLEGWIDHIKTWRVDLRKRISAGQDIAIDLLLGAQFIDDALSRADEPNAAYLKDAAAAVKNGDTSRAVSDELYAVMQRFPDL